MTLLCCSTYCMVLSVCAVRWWGKDFAGSPFAGGGGGCTALHLHCTCAARRLELLSLTGTGTVLHLFHCMTKKTQPLLGPPPRNQAVSCCGKSALSWRGARNSISPRTDRSQHSIESDSRLQRLQGLQDSREAAESMAAASQSIEVQYLRLPAAVLES
jgi:hypothetical protein